MAPPTSTPRAPISFTDCHLNTDAPVLCRSLYERSFFVTLTMSPASLSQRSQCSLSTMAWIPILRRLCTYSLEYSPGRFAYTVMQKTFSGLVVMNQYTNPPLCTDAVVAQYCSKRKNGTPPLIFTMTGRVFLLVPASP